MIPLDSRTVDRIAKIVVDIDGPFQRSGRQLEQLLRAAGWTQPPDYDGSPRIPWLVEALAERANDRVDVEHFLCRICDPLEYDDGMAAAQQMQQEINRILAPEHLEISYIAGQPVIAELGHAGGGPVFISPDDLEVRLRRLIAEKKVVDVLLTRVVQSQKSESGGAYLLALFGIGSFVEGLLYSILTEQFPELLQHGFQGRDGKKITADRAGLALLIDTAHEKELIQLDAKNFIHPIRDFRNYIHPRNQMESAFMPDEDTVSMCWPPIQALLNDLDNSIAASP